MLGEGRCRSILLGLLGVCVTQTAEAGSVNGHGMQQCWTGGLLQ